MAKKPKKIKIGKMYADAINAILIPGTTVFQFDKNFRFASPLFKKGTPFALNPEELLGKRLDKLLPHYLVEGIKAKTSDVIKTKSPQIFDYDLNVRGKIKTFNAIITPTLQPETKQVEYVVVIMDVTDKTGKEQAEAMLKKSEEVLRHAFQIIALSNDAIIGKLLDGKIVSWNSAAEEMYGYSAKEAIGKNVEMLLPSDRKNEMSKILAKIKRGKRISHYETVRLTKKGELVQISLSVSPIKDSNGKVIGASSIARNITTQKKGEEALRKSENKYKTLYDSLADAIMTLSPINYRHLSGNLAALKLYRVKNEKELVTTKPWDLSPLKQPDGTLSSVKAKQMIGIAMKKGSHSFEWAYMKSDGTDFLASVLLSRVKLEGKMLLQATVRNITERKKAEDALKESEGKYRSLVENVPDIIWTFDEKGNTPFISNNVKNIVGFTPEEIRKMGPDAWFGRIHPDNIAGVQKAYTALFKRNKPYSIEYRIRRKDGVWIWLIDHASKTYERDGIRYADGAFTDITGRKEAEELLRRSEEKFRILASHAVDWVYWVDRNREFVYISPSCERISGYRPEEFMKDKGLMARIVHPDDKASFELHRRLYHSGKRFSKETGEFDFRLVAKDGRVGWVSHTCRPIFGENGGFIGRRATVHDITERKKTERHLLDLNRMLWTIRGVNQLITRIKDADTFLEETCKHLASMEGYGFAWIGLTDNHGRFTKAYGKGGSKEMDKVLESLLGGKEPRCVKKALKEDTVLVKGATAACNTCPLAKMCRNRSVIAVSLKSRNRRYGVLLVNLPLEIGSDEDELSLFRELAGDLGFALHGIEAEERRRRSEKALSESETRFKTIFENAPDGILIADAKNQRFVMANKAIRRMIGYSDGEIRGMGVMDIHPKKDLPYVMRQFQLQMKGEIISSGDLPVQRKDGSVFYAEVNSFPITLGGRPFLLGVFRDMTERKKLEQMTKDYAIKLESDVNTRTAQLVEEKRKVEALSEVKDEFMRNITHELKTPLAVILGNLSLLKDIAPMGKEKEWSKMLDMLNRNSERLRNSIDQILQLSRLEAVELREDRVYLKSLIEEAYKEHLPLAKIKGIELRMNIEPVVMMGDSALIKLAINNLVSNAVKFTDCGSVTITARALDDSIVVSVADTGIGISPKNRKRLFERFFKVNPAAPGTGIGLTIIKQIVEKHGGKIDIKSVPGKGSTFDITLPREPERERRKKLTKDELKSIRAMRGEK